MLPRRRLLSLSGLGFGHLALNSLLRADTQSSIPQNLHPRPPHFNAPAKAIIQLVHNGGPSQIDLFDPKPMLQKMAGQPHPDGVEIHQPNNANTLLPSPFTFRKNGQSGIELAEIMPELSKIADELCLIRSMYTEHNNHPEGLNMLHTCKIFPGRPVLGAWVSYALGSVNQNLPGYIVLRDPEGYPVSGKQLWSNGYLPALYQGVEFSSSGVPVHNLSPGDPLPPGAQKASLEYLQQINRKHQREHAGESELEARIQNYELAARMQLAAADVLDISKETEATRKMYGLDNPKTASYGMRCLMARKLIEAGVRFVQVFPGVGQPWDTHSKLKTDLPDICNKTDLPTVGLIKDLKSRGLLDSTIVMWAGEFGRLPTTQNSDGRDHNRNAFSLFFAGGGFKQGFTYGETDEFGYKSVVDRVSVPSLNATILNAMGLDHAKLIFPHGGRSETPTDVTITGAAPIPALLRKGGVA